MTYSLSQFGDAESELRRLEQQMEAMRSSELPIYESLGLTPGRLLDVGVGSGAYAHVFSQLGYDVTGVDSDPELLGVAMRRESIRCVRADAHALPFQDDAFDAALARLVFQHLADPTRVAREMLRVVQPDGVVLVVDTDLQSLIVTPDPPSLRRARDAWIGDAERHGRNPYVGRKLRSIMIDAGATDVEVVASTTTSDQLGPRIFAELLLAPYANWFDDQRAVTAATEWAANPRSFGMATLVMCRGRCGR